MTSLTILIALILGGMAYSYYRHRQRKRPARVLTCLPPDEKQFLEFMSFLGYQEDHPYVQLVRVLRGIIRDNDIVLIFSLCSPKYVTDWLLPVMIPCMPCYAVTNDKIDRYKKTKELCLSHFPRVMEHVSWATEEDAVETVLNGSGRVVATSSGRWGRIQMNAIMASSATILSHGIDEDRIQAEKLDLSKDRMIDPRLAMTFSDLLKRLMTASLGSTFVEDALTKLGIDTKRPIFLCTLSTKEMTPFYRRKTARQFTAGLSRIAQTHQVILSLHPISIKDLKARCDKIPGVFVMDDSCPFVCSWLVEFADCLFSTIGGASIGSLYRYDMPQIHYVRPRDMPVMLCNEGVSIVATDAAEIITDDDFDLAEAMENAYQNAARRTDIRRKLFERWFPAIDGYEEIRTIVGILESEHQIKDVRKTLGPYYEKLPDIYGKKADLGARPHEPDPRHR